MSKLSQATKRAWQDATSMSQRLWLYLTIQGVLIAVGAVLVVLVGGKVGVAIGTALIASAAAGFALFGYVVLTDRWSRRIEGLLDVGLRQVWSHRSIRIRDDYDLRLAVAHQSIDLIGFGQRSFREDQLENIPTWVTRGAKVRILLLDPDFPSPDFT